MSEILLNNSQNDLSFPNLHYPRLQTNRLGEIVLALSKKGSLTKGILVGKLLDSRSTLSIGQKCSDWEVVGELFDYDGPVTMTMKNRVLASPR